MSATLLTFPGHDTARCQGAATAETFDDLTYARAASYLALGQLYLRDNPLLREPLRPEHLKSHPAGAWRHVGALNLIYAQLNRLVRSAGCTTALLAAPPGAAPALLANLFLEGTYGERVPSVTRDVAGMAALFRAYRGPSSVPPALGAHVLAGGVVDELGSGRRCALAARGATLGSPTSVALCVLEDDDAGSVLSWVDAHAPHAALSDGLVLPVLLTPARPERIERAAETLRAGGLSPLVVDEAEPLLAHAGIAEAFARAREEHTSGRRPALVLAEPIALELPVGADGENAHPASGAPGPGGEWLFLAHARTDGRERSALADWLLSYGPDALFDRAGAPSARVAASIPPPGRRVGEGAGARPV